MERRKFLSIATSETALVGAGIVAIPFLKSWNVREDRVHDFDVSVDITNMTADTIIRELWMGKPVIIYRRSQQDINELYSMNGLKDSASALNDQPENVKNTLRSIKPEIMVIIPVCTHLGCEAPKSGAGSSGQLGNDWKGGFFCPCHGSVFDLAGRVFEGVPAPVNMTVPPYMFKDENTIIIGRTV